MNKFRLPPSGLRLIAFFVIYGASAITSKAIKAAKLIAGGVPEDKQPEISPSKTGGVELYFKFKGSADILIHADGKTISYIREPEEE